MLCLLYDLLNLTKVGDLGKAWDLVGDIRMNAKEYYKNIGKIQIFGMSNWANSLRFYSLSKNKLCAKS